MRKEAEDVAPAPAPATSEESDPPVRWISLVIDCADSADEESKMTSFYLSALGGEEVRSAIRAQGLLLSIRRLRDYKAPEWPSAETQLHLELMVGDRDAGVGRLQALGATLAPHQNPEDPGLRVMLDPAGHPFCVIAEAGIHPDYLPQAD